MADDAITQGGIEGLWNLRSKSVAPAQTELFLTSCSYHINTARFRTDVTACVLWRSY